jgi:hypothetical protein
MHNQTDGRQAAEASLWAEREQSAVLLAQLEQLRRGKDAAQQEVDVLQVRLAARDADQPTLIAELQVLRLESDEANAAKMQLHTALSQFADLVLEEVIFAPPQGDGGDDAGGAVRTAGTHTTNPGLNGSNSLQNVTYPTPPASSKLYGNTANHPDATAPPAPRAPTLPPPTAPLSDLVLAVEDCCTVLILHHGFCQPANRY